MIRRLLAVWLASFGFAAGFVSTASDAAAGLLPVSVSVTPQAGNFRWTYAIVLPTDAQLQAGNFFTIYDFKGFVPDSVVAPEGWEFTLSNLGPTPALVRPQDDPNLPNLSFRYTGDTINVGQTGLGNFWAVSEFGNKTDSYFTSQTNRASDGLLNMNITTTNVPVPSSNPIPEPPSVPELPPAVPEPTTLVLAGLGLPLVALVRKRKLFQKNTL